jgi:hypothetical protein
MKYKIFKDGELLNTIVADAEFVAEYCEENGYTYEEMPDTPVEEPETGGEKTAQDDTDAMLIDHEYRLTLLELGVTE